MDDNLIWQRGALMKKAAASLEKNNFTVHIANTPAEAAEKALELIEAGESVAFGGSQTAAALGLAEQLKGRGNRVIAPKAGSNFEESLKVRREALTADVFIASPNAVTYDGKLYFADKIGNRAAGMMFGPKKVIAVAGSNKLVPDEASAKKRVETLAGPANAKRLKLKTPCAETGLCSDCDSPARICNISMTLHKRPAYTQYHIILLPGEHGY